MTHHRILALCAIAALAMPASAQARSCSDAIATLRDALTSAPLAEVVQIQRNQVEPSCLGPQAAAAARAVALRHVQEATRRASPPERMTLLRDGLRFSAEPWQLHDALGDALQAVGNFAGATTHYQLAMNAARDLAPGLAEPQRVALQALIGKAQQARLLSPVVIALPPTRDGTPGGLGLRSLRGVEVEAVAQPIHFLTDSDEPTPEGLAAIRQVQELLRADGNPAITLVGHTDERGSDAHNDALSLRRAQRVAAILIEGGYALGAIRVDGRGKREPFRVVQVPGVTYSREQRLQLDRRVELLR
ncbi:OmpA family protein [Falsiroseomonas stagni]|uniref:Outer membrane protein OmpA n=1 Tax=Falsiroseomonas stagni DSM 19981 TaxID=1123062 RepID=A0A1I4FDZ9_9PROT|nr:OmpA family protein [Falsiroseomonas stagni]SFL16118.1 Outer membrane protein OmpA [Falsiroseomonas stagni DSM 19981]